MRASRAGSWRGGGAPTAAASCRSTVPASAPVSSHACSTRKLLAKVTGYSFSEEEEKKKNEKKRRGERRTKKEENKEIATKEKQKERSHRRQQRHTGSALTEHVGGEGGEGGRGVVGVDELAHGGPVANERGLALVQGQGQGLPGLSVARVHLCQPHHRVPRARPRQRRPRPLLPSQPRALLVEPAAVRRSRRRQPRARDHARHAQPPRHLGHVAHALLRHLAAEASARGIKGDAVRHVDEHVRALERPVQRAAVPHVGTHRPQPHAPQQLHRVGAEGNTRHLQLGSGQQ